MSEQLDSILIFAAGFGTRMGALTTHMPKPLVPVAGKPMIDRAITLACQANLSNITVNLHYKFEMLQHHLANERVNFSIEQPLILDTGGGLRQALPHTGKGPVFTLNPDAIWLGNNPLSILAKAWDPDKMDALLLLIPPENAESHNGQGDFTLSKNGTLGRGPGQVFSGAQIIKTELFSTIPETTFSLNLMWDIFAKNNTLFGVTYPGKWCDVGTPEGITIAEDMLKEANV